MRTVSTKFSDGLHQKIIDMADQDGITVSKFISNITEQNVSSFLHSTVNMLNMMVMKNH